METKKSVSLKVVVLLLAAVLVIGGAVGGTLAWLVANSGTVTNTFVVGDIGELKLSENGEEIITATTKSFRVVPGNDITKDISVSYSYTDDANDKLDDVPVYVFVKVSTTGWEVETDNKTYKVTENSETMLSWSVDSSWTYLTTEGNDKVYYCVVAENADLTADVISNNGIITVSNEITKDIVGSVSAKAGDIAVTAYAIQQEGFETVSDAWTAAKS